MDKKFAVNRKAFFNFFIDEQFEAGIALNGAEVKAIRAGLVNITEGIVHLRGSEAFLCGVDINADNRPAGYNISRERKLLLHRKEILRMEGKLSVGGASRIIPLEIYGKNHLIKIRIGLCRFKKKYDKRETIKKREDDRRILKALHRKNSIRG